MTTQFSVNPKGSSESSRSLFVSAGRCMAGCHPMANGHASNEPETTRTEPTRAERPASRREAVMADGLQAPSKTRATQTKLTRKKRNSRMTDAPGGGPGSVILANSFLIGRRCISESRDSAAMARCPLPSPPLDVVLPPEQEPWRTRAANATCCASYMRRRIQ